MHKRHLKLGWVIGCALLLAACTSLTQLAYNQLDWWMIRKVNRFVDLNPEQKKATKAAIAEFHNWHRTTQLPRYASFLEDFNDQVRTRKLTGEDIHARIDQAQEFLDAASEHLIPAAIDIMPSLSDEQVQSILKNIAEEREEYIDEYVDVSDAKRQDKHYDNLLGYTKPWLGRLTKEQKTWVRDWSKTLEPFEALNAEQQVLWQQDIAKLLSQREKSEQLEANLKDLMFYRTDDWDPTLEAILDRNQTLTYELLARLINEATPEQKEHLHTRLADFSKDFLVLAGKD